MNADLGALSAAAVSIGFVHTLFGPDHYVPFVAMSRVGGWSRRKTLFITLLCGLAHVGSSVLLGFIGLALGLIVFQLETVETQLETIETQRGNVAGWLLIAFGVAYSSWGLVQALRNRPHTHLHVHPDGTVHTHEHVHLDEHLHPHARLTPSMTPWILFAIFAFGPCEPLIPLLMYPAAKADLWSAACVTTLFALTTLATMTTMVLVLCAGANALRFDKLTRYSHALAGMVVLSCGLAVKVGLQLPWSAAIHRRFGLSRSDLGIRAELNRDIRMDQTSGTEFFASLAPAKKLQMLANVSYNVTMVARDTYDDDGGVSDAARLRALNEVQHRCLSVLCALASRKNESRMPDEAVVAIFFAPRDDAHVNRLLQYAFERAATLLRNEATLGQTA